MGWVSFNSLYEILEKDDYLTLEEMIRTFNSLYEILCIPSNVNAGPPTVTFNSLYEILMLLSSFFLKRLFTFNSLYEILNIENERLRTIAYFQFSL